MDAKQLQEWRRRNGYSQGKLSKVLGVDVMTVSRWERQVTAIPPFLHLTLECLEKKGDELKKRVTKIKPKGR
jgi:DNA-binding transcriptional regulator YiaG